MTYESSYDESIEERLARIRSTMEADPSDCEYEPCEFMGQWAVRSLYDPLDVIFPNTAGMTQEAAKELAIKLSLVADIYMNS